MSETNPYQSPSIPESPTANLRLSERDLYFAALGQAIVGGIGLLSSLYNVGFWSLVLFEANPIYPSAPDQFSVQMVVVSGFMTFQSLLIIAGSVSLFQHKRRWLALTGAWAGILPMCGCYLISLIAGIWILIVLRRPEVKALFAANQRSSSAAAA